ncbi:MAG: Bug family tripartite tricarboxylate transporter substrate binding protein [Gemmatimonas sp.]
MRVCRWLFAAALFVSGGPVHAQSVADFYKGTQIKLIISSDVGGGYDAYARAIARYWGKHIPGNPTLVPQNMPGAGGVRAGNFLWEAAPKDGSAIGSLQNTVPFEPLLGNKQALFDPTKFQWLGSPSQEISVLTLWHTVPVNTIADAKKHEMILGASGSNSTPAFYARVLEAVFDIKIKLISGYKGQTESLLGMERGENEGYSSAFWSSLKAVKPDWIRDKKIKFIVQYGLAPTPELKDVPFALDLIQKPADKQLMEVASAQLALGRPFLVPPNVPADRVKVLRTSLMETFKDPGYLADCEKQRLECDSPVTGDQLQDILAKAYATPKDVLDRLRNIYEAGK